MPGGCCFSSSIASVVGTLTSLTWRCAASRLTSSITGSAPVPVPTMRHRQFHGISSSMERGVWGVAEGVAEFLGGLFLALSHCAAVDDDVMQVGDAVDANGAEGESLEPHGMSPFLYYVNPSALAALRSSGALTQSMPP